MKWDVDTKQVAFVDVCRMNFDLLVVFRTGRLVIGPILRASVGLHLMPCSNPVSMIFSDAKWMWSQKKSAICMTKNYIVREESKWSEDRLPIPALVFRG